MGTRSVVSTTPPVNDQIREVSWRYKVLAQFVPLPPDKYRYYCNCMAQWPHQPQYDYRFVRLFE